MARGHKTPEGRHGMSFPRPPGRSRRSEHPAALRAPAGAAAHGHAEPANPWAGAALQQAEFGAVQNAGSQGPRSVDVWLSGCRDVAEQSRHCGGLRAMIHRAPRSTSEQCLKTPRAGTTHLVATEI